MNVYAFATEYAVAIDAPPSAVFSALTEPEKIVAFWGEPSVYQTTAWEHEFRIGGSYRHSTLHFDAGSPQPFARVGEYNVIDAPRSLAYTSKYENDNPIPGVTTIRFDVTPADDGKTRLQVTQSGFETEQVRDMHYAAWVQVFTWLKDYLERQPLTDSTV